MENAVTDQRTQPARAGGSRRWRRCRSDGDVAVLARSWAAGWVAGAPVARWLKYHVDEMTRLIHDEGWSWQDLTEAMNQAGIFYRTGRPWSPDLLSDKAARARRELRAARAALPKVELVPQNGAQPGQAPSSSRRYEPGSPVFDPNEDFEPIDREPEFKVATLRGWSRPASPATQPGNPKPIGRDASQAEAPEIDVEAVLREFVARPRYGAVPMPQPLEPEDD
jgi:hypothetical protein